MIRKICNKCGKSFMARHGNARYCSNANCAYEALKERSRNEYQSKSLKADMYWKNEAVLREFYNRYGNNYELDPADLDTGGFDSNLYSAEKDMDGYKVFYMNKFGFYFLNNKKIKIIKL